MEQYYHCVVQNVDDIKRMYPNLNLDNCIVMNEDGTQFGSQQVSKQCKNNFYAFRCEFFIKYFSWYLIWHRFYCLNQLY